MEVCLFDYNVILWSGKELVEQGNDLLITLRSTVLEVLL
jgi:hypothetical protein